jgi:pyrroloquinoline quinone biosynthesis protein B
MRIKVLGSSAGGGFPQWNCACSNCSRFRQGAFNGPARSQAQLAVSLDDRRWCLLGASPDLRAQLESTPELLPREAPRDTPIAAVILASADLDHILGVLLLREFQHFRIYATPAVEHILRGSNKFFRMLEQQDSQAHWIHYTPNEPFEIAPANGAASDAPSGVICRPISMVGDFPAYVQGSSAPADLPRSQAVASLLLESRNSGKRFLYAPSLPTLDPSLLSLMESCDLILVDGTFWTDDELQRLRGQGRSARQMGHTPLSGPRGTIEALASLRRPRKFFIHMNNTNPMLDESGPECRATRDAGWEISHDGMEFEL